MVSKLTEINRKIEEKSKIEINGSPKIWNEEIERATHKRTSSKNGDFQIENNNRCPDFWIFLDPGLAGHPLWMAPKSYLPL